MSTETKREKFIRLAEARTNKTIEMIRLIGNLSSKGNYDYSKEDVNQIFNTLEKEIKNARARFEGAESKEEKFKLK